MFGQRVARRARGMAFLAAWALLLTACGGGGSFDAQGLAFDYPDGFVEAGGTSRKTLILSSPRPEAGVLTVVWEQGGQPDAGRVITTTLAALGADGDVYDDRGLDLIEFVDVPGATAHYLEMSLRASRQPGLPGYFARLLVLEGANGFGYIIGQVVAAEHRDDEDVVESWEHLRTSLRFETISARP